MLPGRFSIPRRMTNGCPDLARLTARSVSVDWTKATCSGRSRDAVAMHVLGWLASATECGAESCHKPHITSWIVALHSCDDRTQKVTVPHPVKALALASFARTRRRIVL
jgi:hypothetical protein